MYRRQSGLRDGLDRPEQLRRMRNRVQGRYAVHRGVMRLPRGLSRLRWHVRSGQLHIDKLVRDELRGMSAAPRGNRDLPRRKADLRQELRHADLVPHGDSERNMRENDERSRQLRRLRSGVQQQPRRRVVHRGELRRHSVLYGMGRLRRQGERRLRDQHHRRPEQLRGLRSRV